VSLPSVTLLFLWAHDFDKLKRDVDFINTLLTKVNPRGMMS
jgi:hypothetical protein